jgi:hypothetical protein
MATFNGSIYKAQQSAMKRPINSPVGFLVFPLCFSRHLCTKKQIFKTKKQDKDSRGNGAPPSQFSSLSPPAIVQKKKEQGLIFNASTQDMVAGSGDGVTGRGCFLLGKID